MVSLDIEKNLNQAIPFCSHPGWGTILLFESMVKNFSYSGDDAIPDPARWR